MLHRFIAANRDTIIATARTRLQNRSWPLVSPEELEHGVPLFLTQLVSTLQAESGASPKAESAMGTSAAQHGRELRGAGFSVTQVVEDYGDICQAITGLAVDANEPITPEEFQTLNSCLDIVIARAADGACADHDADPGRQ